MLDVATLGASASAIPFDAARLDALMDAAGMDVLLATSKHNVQYLLGGHRAMFFGFMDAMGVSRYLPVFVYVKGAPEKAFYVGHRTETQQRQVAPFWVPEARTDSWGSVDAVEKAVEYLRRIGFTAGRVGVETAFLPWDSAMALQRALPGTDLADALSVLEELRAVKRPDELAKMRLASEKVVESMLAVIAAHGPGATKQQLADAMRREEAARGLTFEYLLVAAGTSLNRAPSSQRWEQGDVLSLDSGGNYDGYIGDLARMAILGEPDAELQDLLAGIEAVQRAAMRAVRPGERGGAIYAAAEAALHGLPERAHMHFVAHGVGLVTHEAPHLTERGPVPYPAEDAGRALEAGMVLSIETTLQHPRRGFIKLEDTVAVTDTGHEVFADTARGWNRGGRAA